MLPTWVAAVFSLITSSAAICRLLRPGDQGQHLQLAGGQAPGGRPRAASGQLLHPGEVGRGAELLEDGADGEAVAQVAPLDPVQAVVVQDALRATEPAAGAGQLAGVEQLEGQPQRAARRPGGLAGCGAGLKGPGPQARALLRPAGQVGGRGEPLQVVDRQGRLCGRRPRGGRGTRPRPTGRTPPAPAPAHRLRSPLPLAGPRSPAPAPGPLLLLPASSAAPESGPVDGYTRRSARCAARRRRRLRRPGGPLLWPRAPPARGARDPEDRGRGRA